MNALASALRADPALAALHRSLDVYYGDPARDAAMDKLYRGFLRPGDIAFDIGSHVGDRIGSFRRCGARVVALEPQPDCARAILESRSDPGDWRRIVRYFRSRQRHVGHVSSDEAASVAGGPHRHSTEAL